jgi:hypothetical protein
MSALRKPTVCIDVTHHDVPRGHVTGFNFTVDYAEGQASVTMLDFPPLSEAELERAFRQRLLDLAKALQDVGQSSQGVFWHHR